MDSQGFFKDGQSLGTCVPHEQGTLGDKLGYWASRSLGYVLLCGSIAMAAALLI